MGGPPVIAIFVMVLVLIFFSAMIYLIFRKKRNPSGSVCGGCNYAVDGLTTFICPECGGDLRNVGIITPNQSRPLPGWLKCVFWTAALPIPAVIVSALITLLIGPAVFFRSATWTMEQPASGTFASVQITGSGKTTQWGSGMRWSPQIMAFSRVDLIMFADTGQGPVMVGPALRLDLEGMRAEGRERLDAGEVESWGRSCGLNVAVPAVQAEMAAVADYVTAACIYGQTTPATPSGVFGGTTMAGMSTSSNPAPWFAILLALFWLIIWIVGCIRLMRAAR